MAQWVSSPFAVRVTEWVLEWMKGQGSPSIPDHIRRYTTNLYKIPGTHFSMLNQMIFRLVAPLEAEGYVLPDKLMPDISMGRMFSKWLRENGHDPESFPTYRHEFLDHRPTVDARLYPNQVITEFHEQLDSWLRRRAMRYFIERREEGAVLPLERVLAKLAPPPSPEMIGP